MARQEQDREDLLREATALVERVELCIAGESAPIVVGFRRDGACSIFFGSDPVYQFNARRELRRGYRLGKLLKAEHGRLTELTRERTPNETRLARAALSDADAAVVLHEMRTRLTALRTALETGAYEVAGQVPADADVVGRCRAELAALAGEVRIAASPRVGA